MTSRVVPTNGAGIKYNLSLFQDGSKNQTDQSYQSQQNRNMNIHAYAQDKYTQKKRRENI